jgi:very-short-patch-repair endonuclease
MDPVRALEMRLGASWRSQLRAMGVSDGRLRSAVRKGEVVRLGAGTYALPEAEPDALAAAAARGRITCCSAARRHGLPLLHPVEKPHVAVPRNRPTAADLAVIHRGDVRGTSAVVPVLAALVTLLRCVPPVDAVATVDAAVHLGQVRVSALGTRLRGPGSVEARRVLGMVDGRSESVIESVVRLALRQAGLRVTCQARIEGVGRVDLLVDDWLVVEVDGFAFHADRASYRTDRGRANALAARGYVLVRLTYEDVMYRLPEAVAMITALVAARR